MLDETRMPGWLVTAACRVSDPDAKFIIKGQSPHRGYIEHRVSARMLLEYGLTVPTPAGLWVSRYDDESRIYAITYTPDDWLPFTEGFRVSVAAPLDREVTVYEHAYIAILVHDVEAFARSLRRLLGTDRVPEAVMRALPIPVR
ncbi:MAG: hypothetical protein QXU64_01985 [Thermofilaceae archaeon]